MRPRWRRHEIHRRDDQGTLGIRRVQPLRHLERGALHGALIFLGFMAIRRQTVDQTTAIQQYCRGDQRYRSNGSHAA